MFKQTMGVVLNRSRDLSVPFVLNQHFINAQSQIFINIIARMKLIYILRLAPPTALARAAIVSRLVIETEPPKVLTM